MSSIYDSYDNEFLAKKIRDFDNLLWYAAKRFTIPGVLLPEDLYQEGLLALDETLYEDWQYHPDSEEFTKAFKSRLFHRMSHCLRYHKQGCRDWRKEVHDVIKDFEDEGEEASLLERIPSETYPPPDETVEVKDLGAFLEAIRDTLQDMADNGPLFGGAADDALEILDILMNPIVPDGVCHMYERVPCHLSNALLAEITGWDIMQVRRALKKLRKVAESLAPKYGITIRKRR